MLITKAFLLFSAGLKDPESRRNQLSYCSNKLTEQHKENLELIEICRGLLVKETLLLKQTNETNEQQGISSDSSRDNGGSGEADRQDFKAFKAEP